MTGKWISIEDALPTEYDWVLVSFIDENGLRYVPFVGQLKEHNTWYMNDRPLSYNKIVTHWMPLPKSPNSTNTA